MRAENLLKSGNYKLGSIQEAVVLKVWINERKRKTFSILIPALASVKSDNLSKTMNDYFKTVIPEYDKDKEASIKKELEEIKNMKFVTRAVNPEPDRGILELSDGKQNS